jgi:hypothetical protein
MTTASATFKVRMLKSPSENAAATVYLNQSGFQFSKCLLTFDNTNYNVSQEVEIVAAPSFSAENKEAKIEAAICAPGTPYTNHTEQYTVIPKEFLGKTCKSTGGILSLSFTPRSSLEHILWRILIVHGTRIILLVQERAA